MGTPWPFILAWRAGRGPGNAAPFLSGLRRQALRWQAPRLGHVSRCGLRRPTGSGGAFDPPLRRGGNLVAPDRNARAALVAAARLDGLFGQRWNTEPVNAVIQRTFGHDIRSRLRRLPNPEPIIQGLVYDIYV